MEVCLSLGSNLGDRLASLQSCRDQLDRHPHISVTSQSAVYETDPVDVPEEFAHLSFLNTIVLIDTTLPLIELFKHMKVLENDMSDGQPHDGNAPRPLDIDLIYAEGVSHESSTLTLPHPRAHARRFVLEPLAELRSDMPFPGMTATVHDLLSSLPAKPGLSKLTEAW